MYIFVCAPWVGVERDVRHRSALNRDFPIERLVDRNRFKVIFLFFFPRFFFVFVLAVVLVLDSTASSPQLRGVS